MKSLKPTPTRVFGVGAAPRPARARQTRTIAVALVALLGLVSPTSASLTASRAGLGGSSSSDRPHLSSTEAKQAPRVVAAAREASAGDTGLDYSPTARALFAAPQLPTDEAVEILDGDCALPKTTFNLGERVCARVNNAVVGGSEFFPIIPLRKFSWINPAGLQVQANVISAATQTSTFTLPADETTTFGGTTVDNRGGWRVVVASLFDSSERAAAGFTARKPNAAAVDLSVLTTQEQKQERVPAGSQAPFLITVENKGPDAAASVELRVPVPDYTTFFSITPPAGFTCVNPPVGGGPGGTSVCSTQSLPAGASGTFTAVYLIGGETPTDSEVTAEVTIASTTTERHQPDNTSAASYLVASQPQCVITVPDDITVPNEIVDNAPTAGAVVTYGAPTTQGNCGTVTCTPPSGSFFPVGETYVSCANSSQTVIERFRVIVNDTLAPTISCPADYSVPESAPGSGDAVVNFTPPTVTDNDPNVQVTFDPPNGLPLTVADSPHTVTATATDASGNTATCTFKVTVTERENNCTITPDVATLPTLTSDCSVAVSNIPTAVDSCAGRIAASTDDPRFYDTPGTYTIRWKYTSSGQSVTQDQTVVVTGGSGALSITGPPSVSVGGGSCPFVIGDLGATLQLNIGGGSCANSDVTHDISPPAPGNVFVPGTAYTIISTVSDGANSASVTQTLNVGGNDAPPTITAPADAAYECPANVPAANPSQATAADNCGVPTVTVNETNNGGAGSAASPLVITRTFTATDGGGKTASDSQTITVIDNTAPAITAPPDKTVNADPTSCAVAVALGTPTYSDNCNAHVTNDAPALFPVGVTTVTWTATDDAGNATVATQKVTVVDVTKPVITLNGAGAINHECHTAFTDPGATASDNCSVNVQVSAAGAVDVNTLGTYTITYTATDAAGNAAVPVTRTVNVVDTTPPAIACPTDITVYLPLNSTAVSMPVSFAVTAGDSCDSTPSVALSHAPGSIFPVGTTAVTATATDDSGNSSSCTFNVTVLYNFTGFFSPVENPPTLNQVSAGRAIPVKFSLSGNKGLSIFEASHPASQQIACNTSAPISDIEETVTAGGSSLTYEAGSDRYHYVWKTNSAWAGTCRQLVIKLNDGSSHTAFFKFK